MKRKSIVTCQFVYQDCHLEPVERSIIGDQQRGSLGKLEMTSCALVEMAIWILFVIAVIFSNSSFAKTKIRVGFLPNLTHAQALIGKNLGFFQKALGDDVQVDWRIFNNSSNMVEALFIGDIDLMYIGPNPAITAYVRSHGAAIRIIAGSSANGASLVVRKDSAIQKIEDLPGKKIAFPNVGGTQDVSLKLFLKNKGYKTKSQGGDIELYSLPSREQVNLFHNQYLDASWAPEPWVSILEKQTGARVLFEEKELWPEQKFATTLLTVRKNFLEEHPDWVKTWVRTQVEVTEWMKPNQDLALQAIQYEIAQYLRKPMPDDILRKAYARILFTYDPLVGTIKQMAKGAFALGYYGDMNQEPDIKNLFSFSDLATILKEKHLYGIKD